MNKIKRTDNRRIDNREELQTEICERIAAGETLSGISDDAKMPSRGTINNWLNRSEVFAMMYSHAQAIRRHRWSEEVVEIADSIPAGTDGADLQRIRTQIDARKWAAGNVQGGIVAFGGRSKAQRKAELADQLQVALDNGLTLKEVIAELRKGASDADD